MTEWGLVALVPAIAISLLDISLLARYISGSHGGQARTSGEPVSVIVAAYNAQRTIRGTLESIISGILPEGSEIIVVDDGSTDDTLGQCREVDDRRIVIVHEGHVGKWSALNRGAALARHEHVVMVDADTEVDSDAIAILSRRLDECDAVAGNLFVKGNGSVIGRVQAQEHLRISMFRRSEGAVETVSGPLAAFRRDLLMKNPFRESCVEDFEHTARIRRGGARICYEPLARARTSMPSGFGDYLRQRSRWARGTLEEMRAMGIPMRTFLKGYMISILDVMVIPLCIVFGRYDAIMVLFAVEALVQSYGSYKETSVVTPGSVLFLPMLIFLAFMHLYMNMDALFDISHNHNNV
ncbi:MAG TPA: glycosyltransferase family 2 protein [Candidatus Methanofastidiosa archaeon]|nr:glycosyltransferase family 2 protein [Candidatus Methanofastidiosa archaeon]